MVFVSTGPISLARRGWGLREKTITSFVANDSGGRPDVLCAQMLLGAAASGAKTLVLLTGQRSDDPVWVVIGNLLGGKKAHLPGEEDGRRAADNLRQMPLVMYASGTGREHVGKADLVYAPGLHPEELERLRENTPAPILTLSDVENGFPTSGVSSVIRVGGDTIVVDREGFEVSVVYDPDGPVYRPA